MCLSVFNLKTIMKLGHAAQHIQKLVDDGTLAEAFGKNKSGEAHECVTAFNLLGEAAAAVGEEYKEVSPFLRYRKEIMGGGYTPAALRELVMNLWDGRECNLGALLKNSDQHHTRITLECIASYAHLGENDRHFMNMVSEIRDSQDEVAA